MHQPARSSQTLLTLAGAVSALFTVGVMLAGYSARVSVGFTFGVALAAYFVWYERCRDSFKIAAFVCACTVAFPASIQSLFVLTRWFPDLFATHTSMSSPRLDIPMSVFFAAGCVGAFFVLAAGILLLGPQTVSAKLLGVISLWSLGGGFLGVIGAALDVLRTHGIGSSTVILFLVWQPGVALLLGLLLERQRESAAESSATSADGPGAPRS